MDLPRFILTSITAYDETDRFIEHDADGSPNQLLEIDWEDDSAQWTQELRMLSAPAQALEWIVGLYYFDRTVRIAQVNDVLRELRPVLGFNPDAGVFTVKARVDADISAYAAFGQLHFDVTDKTRILADYDTRQRNIPSTDSTN